MPPPIRRTITVKRADPSSTSVITAETSAIARSAALDDGGPAEGKKPETSRADAVSSILASTTKDVKKEDSTRTRISSPVAAPKFRSDMSAKDRPSTREQEMRKSSVNQETKSSTIFGDKADKTGETTAASFTSAASARTRMKSLNIYTLASGNDPERSTWETSFVSPSQETAIATSSGARGTAAAAEPTRPATSTISHRQEPEVPELPQWLVLFIFASLIAGLILTMVLYFANFPPSYPKWIPRRKKRYEYMRIGDLEEDLHGDIYRSFRKSSAAAAAAAATSVYSPHLHEARRRPWTPGVNVMSMGLGISVTPPPRPSNPLAIRKRPSFETDAAQLYRPFPKLPSKAAPNPWRSLTDPLPNVKSFLTQWSGPQTAEQACYELRERNPDVESGLLKPPSPDFDSAISISSSRSSSSSRLSSSDVFNKIADGVDYAASKLARMMDHQVRDDPEEGLLLPTRAVRRGPKLENGKLKKVL